MIPTGKKQNLEPGEFQPPFYAGVTLLQNIILSKRSISITNFKLYCYTFLLITEIYLK